MGVAVPTVVVKQPWSEARCPPPVRHRYNNRNSNPPSSRGMQRWSVCHYRVNFRAARCHTKYGAPLRLMTRCLKWTPPLNGNQLSSVARTHEHTQEPPTRHRFLTDLLVAKVHHHAHLRRQAGSGAVASA